MAGRKRLPDHLKIVKGTAQKCRMNPDAPVADIDSPRPPAWLSRRAVEHFAVLRERIAGLGIASKTDTEALAIAAMRMAEIEECDRDIEQLGRVLAEEGKTPRANPAVGQRSEAMRHLQSLLAEFGLTPAARSKVTAPKKEQNANPFAKVSGTR
jgi:P27 family predicted phage terminase small subunit